MNFQDIKARSTPHTLAICERLLSEGKKIGNQWVVGSIQNTAGDSCYVDVTGSKAGLWHDFASNEGGDIIDLVAKALGCQNSKAADWLVRFCGISNVAPDFFDPLKKSFRKSDGEPWQYGTRAWAYRRDDGTPYLYAVRFEKEGGKKDVLPLQHMPAEGETPDPNNPKQWRWKGVKPPPIYNAHQLAKRPDAPVLVVEGEKTADAAAKLFPDRVVISWMGGCKKVEDVDWSPLKGRTLLLWPDNDKPGINAMRFIKVRFPAADLIIPPASLPEGWDLADPLPAGVLLADLLNSIEKPKPPTPSEPAATTADDELDVHYDQTTGKWWIVREKSRPGLLPGYVAITSETARKIFISHGFAAFKDHDGLTDVDREMIRRIRSSDMFYAGPLAGRRAGLYPSALGDYLVTSDRPVFKGDGAPAAKAAETCARLRQWLFELCSKDEEQYWRLLFWLHLRRKSQATATWRHGHLLVLIGSADCGKSYLQTHIITNLLGGRIAKPYRYMSGNTDFNGDLIAAEHLIIEDDAPGRDMHSRRLLGSNVKSMLFAEYQSAHPKNKQAVTLAPIWAMSMSMNNEEENLMTLPPMEKSMRDKVIILSCQKPELQLVHKPTQWEELAYIVETQLPALATYLDSLQIPDDVSEPRCGLKAYQNPTIMAALTGMTPETSLMQLIDEVLFDKDDSSPLVNYWEGSARELERRLRSTRSQEMDRICRFDSACGVLMKRLIDAHPKRISRRIRRGTTLWRIEPPSSEPSIDP